MPIKLPLKLRVRSPSYPAIDLETAISRAQAIYDREKWHEVPVDVVLKHWNYSQASGGGLVQIAALKKYGLLMDHGSGAERKVRLTALAKDILIPDDEGARLSAIQRAAHSPLLYQEVLNRYADGLPSDATLRAYLIKDKGFNDNAVADLISVMRKTFEFARLGYGDTIAGSSEDKASSTPRSEALARHQPEAGHMQCVPITLVLDRGAITVVQVPRMPVASFELFKTLLETYRTAIVMESNVEDSP